MSLQDLNTYVETDPAGVMTVSSDGTRVTFTNADRDNDAHLDSDKGDAILGDGDYTFEVEVQSAVNRSIAVVNILCDTNGNWVSLIASEPLLNFAVARTSGGVLRMQIDQYNPFLSDIFDGFLFNTHYFITFNRNGSTVTVDIYDNPAKLVPVDTLVITGALTTAFQWHEAISTALNVGLPGREIDAWAQNFDLPIEVPLPTGELRLDDITAELELDNISPELGLNDITPELEVFKI
jgi:hypothetical protein